MGRIAEREALRLKLEAYVTIPQCVVMLAMVVQFSPETGLNLGASKRRKWSLVGEVKDHKNNIGSKTTKPAESRKKKATKRR